MRAVGGIAATVIVVALLGFGASATSASTTVGADPSPSGGTCGGGINAPFMMVQTASPGNSYAAPFDGVFTSWTSNTTKWHVATLKVVRLGSGNTFTVLGQDGPRPSDGTVNPIRIPVRQGDVLGLLFPPQEDCPGGINPGNGFYVVSQTNADVPPGPGTFDAGPFPSFQISVTAQIEHDADGDGYGDETQDGCPTDAAVQGPCPLPDTTPPDTSITQGPKKKTSSKKATFEFASTEPGSTFECSLDSSGFAPCTSPDTLKARKTGKHNFLVRARDSHGNLDTSEASWTWKVAKKKHQKHKH